MKNKEVSPWVVAVVIALVVGVIVYVFWYTTTPHPRKPPPGVDPMTYTPSSPSRVPPGGYQPIPPP
jgi:hypothetical protein